MHIKVCEVNMHTKKMVAKNGVKKEKFMWTDDDERI